MKRLEIHFFGGLGISLHGGSACVFPTREAEAVFSFLVLNRGRVFAREALVGYFYADECDEVARKRLRTALWRVRTGLESAGIKADEYIIVRNREVGFNTSGDYWLDIEDFEGRLATLANKQTEVCTPAEVRLLDSAVSLYRGDLLEGLCSEWCLRERERLRMLLLNAIEKLMNYYAANEDWATASQHAHNLLHYDPLREHVHRDLMRFYYYNGDRPSALRQYRICAELLRAELGIEPMRETAELRARMEAELSLSGAVVTMERSSLTSRPHGGQPRTIDFTHLDNAMSLLDEARQSLALGIGKLKRSMQRDPQ